MEINKPIVRHRIRGAEIIRKGRGYSLEELKAARLNRIDIARRNGIPVDKLRKTTYPDNVEQLRPIVDQIRDLRKSKRTTTKKYLKNKGNK